MSDERAPDDRDERIRLLTYQADFLRREVETLTRQRNAIVYSAAWTLARPIKRVEDALHALVRRVRKRDAPRTTIARVPDVAPIAGSTPEQIAARIAAHMEHRTVPR